MNSVERKAKGVISNYAQKMPLYRDFAFSVKHIIEEIIKKEDLQKYVQVISAREKSTESLGRKLLNKKFKDNPSGLTYLEKNEIKKFSDVKDLAGVRIILYFKGDILNKLRMALQEEFDYSSKDEQRHKDANGQESIHSWIKFNNSRLSLSEYAKFKDLKCEIQLVTILQHAWSELEHDIVYKPQDGWEKAEVDKFDNMFKEAKAYIKKASDMFESIMYIHINGDKFLLFDKFEDLDNNKIYEYLERLRAYMEKNYLRNDIVLKDVLEKIEKIVTVSSNNKVVKEKNVFGDLEGKTFRDVLSIILGILGDSRIKYSSKENFQKIFESAVSWSNMLDNKDKKDVKDFFERLSQYDLEVLKHIGLFNQKLIIDIISKWSDEYKTKNIHIVKIVVKKLLQPSFESRNMVEWNKFQFSSGSLLEDKKGNLRRIRRRAIDLIISIYDLTSDDKTRLELVAVLDEAARTPHSGSSDSLEKIIISDVNYLIDKYKNIVFDSGNNIICSLPEAMEIERQLLWLKKRWSEKEIKGVDEFIQKIRKNKKYFIYGQLIDRSRLDFLDKENKKKEEEEKEKEISTSRLIEKIKANKQWLKILNDIARASKIEEDWKFNDFHAFLTELTEKKFKIGEYFLKDAIMNDTVLLDFSDAFIIGFRNIGKLDLWDDYVSEVEKKQSGDLMSKILHSFYFHFKNSKKKKFRIRDFKWIKNTADRKGRYEFLSKDDYNRFNFDYKLFRAMIVLWRYRQKEIEKLLINEMNLVNENNLAQKLDDIEMFSSWNDIDIKKFDKESLEFMVDCLIRANRIDFHGEDLATAMGEINFNFFLKIIKGRLDLSDRPRKRSKFYDAIPTHLSEEFIKFIKQNQKKFKNGMISWIMKKKMESFNYYECGSLLRSLDNIHSEIVMELVHKNTLDSMTKSVALIRSFDGIDVNLAFQVADSIVDSKSISGKEKDKLLKYIGGQMYSTGLVSGEHGVSEEHKKRAGQIAELKQKMERDNKNKKLIKFTEEMIKYLNESAAREYIDEERRFKMMEIDFQS